MANEGICLDALEIFTANKSSSVARIVNCVDTTRQLWLYDFQTQHIIQQTSNNCLTAQPNSENASVTIQSQKELREWNIMERHTNNGPNTKNEESKFNVSTTPCTASIRQKWILLPFEWK